MKRKLFMTIIAVLIVCLTCGMLLVACNKGDGDGGGGKPPVPETRPESSVTMLNTVWNQIASSINVGEGKKFVADFDIALNIDDETEANNDVVYSLIGKASVDVNAGQESDIYIELKETKNGESRILFGFAYDVETVGDVATPYIYVNVADGGYRKINGFSLTELVAAIVAAQPAEATAAGVDFGQILENLKKDPTTIFPVLVELVGLIDSQGTISDYGKTFNFNVNFDKLFSFLGTALTDEILAGIGISAEQSAAIAQQVGAILGFENVENIGGLCKAVADALMFVNCELVFRFDDEQIFQSAEIKVDYNKNVENVPENVANYTVSVNKARIDLGSLDVFAGSAITEEVRAQEAINLLNFSLKGSAVSYKGEEIAHRYTIEVQSDINPFELLGLIGDTSKENIVATLKKLGYFHLEINEVNENGDKVTNIITLHSKFDEGFAVANLNLNDAKYILSLPIGLGGVYDFGGLVDVIGMLTAGNAEATSAAGTDIFGMIFQMLGFFHADNIATDGVTVDIKDLVVTLVGSLGMTLDDTLNTILDQVLDCDSINIKLETPTFGTCTTVETSTIECGIRTASAYKNGKTDFIKEIVSLDGLIVNDVLQYDSNSTRYYTTQGTLEAGNCFEITGINLKGENVKTSGFIMASKGLDISTPGEQDVTFYIAIGSDIKATLKTAEIAGIKLNIDNIPVNGVLVYNAKVNVLPYNKDATVESENLKGADQTVEVSEGSSVNSAAYVTSSKPAYIIVDGIKYALTAADARAFDGDKDVTSEVIGSNGNFIKSGEYSIKYVCGGYTVESVTVTINPGFSAASGLNTGASINGTISIFYNGEYKVYYENGEFVAKDAEGKLLENFQIAFSWDSDGTAVEFKNDGVIAKYPERQAAGYKLEKMNISIQVGEVKEDLSINVKPLYASNKSNEKIGNSIDGYFSTTYFVTSGTKFMYKDGEYGIFKDDVKMCDVTLKVTDAENNDVTSEVVIDGKLAKEGTYKFTYTVVGDGWSQEFFHNVTIKPAA